MDRTIRIIGEKETQYRKQLETVALEVSETARTVYHVYKPLYDAFFFAPPLYKRSLGRFETEGHLIILSEDLLSEPFDVVRSIFLHECAHALDYALHGFCSGHSPEFREYCRTLGIREGFEKAKVKESIYARQTLERRVEKLMALTSSPFENEALEALSKAQKLIAKGALAEKDKKEKDERIYVTDLFESGRTPLYVVWLLSFTGSATGCFLVKCQGEYKTKVTRAYGTLEQVEAALYLFDYLLSSLEAEVKRLKKEGHAITKDSFVMGAVPEMRKKLSDMDEESSTALVLLQNENARLAKKLAFSGLHLRSTKSTGHVGSSESYRLGQKFGQNVDVRTKPETKHLK